MKTSPNLRLWHFVIHPIIGHFRRKRGQKLLQHFPNLATLRICDVGGSKHFWEKTNLSLNFENITIFNINTSETAASENSTFSKISVLLFDGHTIPATGNEFDLVICNSVLEHVPPEKRARLVQEMRRIAPSLFVQTPAFECPLEPHFLLPFVHWLPRSLGYLFVQVSPWRLLSWPDKETIRQYFWGTQLLRRRELAELFPDAMIESERFLGVTKSHLVVVRRN